MKYKKGLIFICLIICLFSIASVCASEVNETVVATEDQNCEAIAIENNNDVVTYDNQVNEDNVSVDGNVDKVGATEENEVSATPGTFTDLAMDIANAGEELNLNRNYTYYNSDSQYQKGITINKKITINGNGFTINGDNNAKTLRIFSDNVVLNNISFINCVLSNPYKYNDANIKGGSIDWLGNKGYLSNCSFINCYVSNPTSFSCMPSGGAIHWSGNNGCITDCEFINCYSNSVSSYAALGGAISFDGSDNCSLINSNFVNCSSSSKNGQSIGGAIYFNSFNGIMSNCNFSDCYGHSYTFYSHFGGGAVTWSSVNGIISNCSFINCSYDTGTGGAIKCDVNNVTLKYCTFVNNSANYGNAISWSGKNGKLINNYYDPYYNSIYNTTDDLTITKMDTIIECNNVSFNYRSSYELPVVLKHENSFLPNNTLIFNLTNNNISKIFSKKTNENGVASLNEELKELSAGIWRASIIFEGNDNYEISSTYANIIVKEIGSFSELYSNISSEQSEITLEKDYIYNSTIDSAYQNGIAISEKITIDGQGHVIDGNHLSKIFNIQANEVILKNISFVNAYSNNDGGAINWYGNKGITINCLFNNNSASKSGGAIYIQGENIQLLYCSFINNTVPTSSNEGGAIYLKGKFGLLSNCSFINNFAFGGTAISLYGNNTEIIDCSFNNNYANGAGSAIYCNSYYNNFTHCSFVNNNASQLAGAIFLTNNNNVFKKCSFINNSANDGGAIIIKGDNNYLIDCEFKNNSASRYGGAVYLISNFCKLDNCSFINNSADYGGAMFVQGNNNTLNLSSFTNNIASTWGGAIYWMGDNGSLINSSFIDNFAIHGGSIFWRGNNGNLINSSFISNVISLNEEVIYWYGENGNLINSIFINNINSTQIMWYSQLGNIEGCKFLNVTKGNVINNGAKFIKRNIDLTQDNYSFYYKDPTPVSVDFINVLNTLPIESQIIFKLFNEDTVKTFNVNLNNNVASICDELANFKVGIWNITVIFEGDDNYYPADCNFTLKINPAYSALNIVDNNATLSHETILITKIVDSNNLSINEGSVVFFDGEDKIGESVVNDGVAILRYTPNSNGEHNIKAIFSSDNYLSSNGASKLYVDSASVELMVNTGTVGYNSTFVANVKGLYSVINEGTVSFYIDNEFIGKTSVSNGVASLIYVPLVAGNSVVKAVFGDSEKFLSIDSSVNFTVDQANSQVSIDNLTGRVGDNLILSANVTSPNGLIINEGTLTFIDNGNVIGVEIVEKGKASINYVPNTEGKHTISAVFLGNNYITSNDVLSISIDKANTELILNNIANTYYGAAISISANVLAKGKSIKEGIVKFYIDGQEIKSFNLVNEQILFDYFAPNVGLFNVTAMFFESDNYLSSQSSQIFEVNKLPTSIASSNIDMSYNEGKYIIATLKDSNGKALNGVQVSININGVKYVTTDNNGQVILPVNGLVPKTYTATITFDGNTNYVKSTTAVNVVVKKATPKLTAKAKTFKKSVKTKKYTITLKNNLNKVMKNTKVTIKLNKKTYIAKTNSKGKATFKITKLTKKGTFKAVVTYKGDKYYNKITKKVNIKVK